LDRKLNIQNCKSPYLQQALNIKKNTVNRKNMSQISVNNTRVGDNPAFGNSVGSVFTRGMRFLATNMAWGAVFIDFFCMDAPRTIVDFGRGVNAGTETGIREGSGTANHSMVGTYGLGAAAVASIALNNKYGVKANSIFADNKTIDYLGGIWHEELKKNAATQKDGVVEKPLKTFLNKVINSIEGYAPSKETSEWKKLQPEDSKELIEKFADYITKLNQGKAKKADRKALENFAKSKFGYSLGTDNALRFGPVKTEVGDALHSDTLVSNVTKLANTFMSDKVHSEFLKTEKFEALDYIKGLKHLNRNIAIGGLAIASAIGMSIQPLNRLHTKKKTGSDEFVGGGKTDKSAKFKLVKTLAALAFATGAIATITTNPSKLLSKLQFHGFTPTMNQFKLVYGLTIASRLYVARTHDELRESSLKDTLGFANWLILGNFVSIGVAKLFEKHSHMKDNNFLKYHNADHKNWLLKSSIVSRDEVLFNALKKAGISTMKDGKPLSFNEMVKCIGQLGEKEAKETRSKLKYLNIIQLAGYVYSGLVLGVGIPKMNIAIKKHKDKKRAEAAKLAGQQAPVTAQEKTQVKNSFASFAGK
jgi:hypothetical protein